MKNKKTIVITICLILIIVLIVSYFSLFKNKQDANFVSEKARETTNYSMFFTVSSCINTYYNYLSIKDDESIMKLLNSDYVKKNKINKDNVFNKLNNYDGNIVSFKAKKMYETKLNNKITIYYAYGDIYFDTINGSEKNGESYLEVRIDNSSRLFDIIPMDKSSYEEVLNG